MPPGAPPPSALALRAADRSADALDASLRAGDPPIIGRIADGELLLDPRTVADDELELVAAALREL